MQQYHSPSTAVKARQIPNQNQQIKDLGQIAGDDRHDGGDQDKGNGDA